MRDESGIEDEDGFTSFPLGIGISLPLLLYVQDKEPFYVRVKDHNASLVFWKATRDEGYYKDNLPFPLDQVDLASSKDVLHYSEARIYFTDDFVDPDKPLFSPASCRPEKLKSFYENVILTDEQMKHFKNEGEDIRLAKVALRILNQFISYYRYETQYFNTPNVRVEDFVVIQIYKMCYKPTFKPRAGESYSDYYDIKMSKFKIYPFTGTRGHLPTITEEQRKKIFDRLFSGEKLPIVSELIISANRHFQEGNYRQAIIDVQTAFEVEIKNRVEKLLARQGMSQDEIENIFERGIVKLLKRHYPKCLDAKPFATESDEYKKWEWAYRVRIAMTHSGSSVPEEDAWQAFGWYHATFRYLFGKDSWILLPELPIRLFSREPQDSS